MDNQQLFSFSSDIILEDFDNETVIINLANGNYFSIDGVSVAIWKMLDHGMRLVQISEILANFFRSDSEKIGAECNSFINQLLEEGLINLSAAKNGQADQHIIKDILSKLDQEKYNAPVLEVYSDMQDLILLDPIHEVDETGWPSVKKEDPKANK